MIEIDGEDELEQILYDKNEKRWLVEANEFKEEIVIKNVDMPEETLLRVKLEGRPSGENNKITIKNCNLCGLSLAFLDTIIVKDCTIRRTKGIGMNVALCVNFEAHDVSIHKSSEKDQASAVRIHDSEGFEFHSIDLGGFKVGTSIINAEGILNNIKIRDCHTVLDISDSDVKFEKISAEDYTQVFHKIENSNIYCNDDSPIIRKILLEKI